MLFEGLITVSRGEMYCKLIGDEERNQTIVVFPGGPGFSYEIYEGHSGHFSAYSNMLFFDPIGSGKSTRLSDMTEYTLDGYIQDAKEMIEHFNLTNFVILGTSYGSMAALNFAITYPDIAQKIILVGGAPSYNFLEAAKLELNRRGTHEQIKAGNKLFAGSFENEEQIGEFLSALSTLYSEKARRTGGSPYKKVRCSIEPLNAAFRYEFDRFNYLDKLEDISIPVLQLVGEHDWINPVSQARLMEERIAGIKLVVIPECGHSVAADAPDIYTREVLDFINVPCCKSTSSFSF